jgi:hypothetical protein
MYASIRDVLFCAVTAKGNKRSRNIILIYKVWLNYSSYVLVHFSFSGLGSFSGWI